MLSGRDCVTRVDRVVVLPTLRNNQPPTPQQHITVTIATTNAPLIITSSKAPNGHCLEKEAGYGQSSELALRQV